MEFVAIIPARYASTRFPGKPLAMLGGKPVIRRVYEQVTGVLPDADMGYAAARAASAAPLAEGAVGAACGARCGRLFCLCQDAAGKPLDLSDKSGLGSLCLEREGIRVAALVVLNALGNVGLM